MALQISEFVGAAFNKVGDTVQIPDGFPLAVSADTFTGTYTVGGSDTEQRLVRISGAGAITWPGVAEAENFNGTEFRNLRAGQTFEVA